MMKNFSRYWKNTAASLEKLLLESDVQWVVQKCQQQQAPDFPNQINVQPAPAVEGDFASAALARASTLAGPGGLVAGAGGLIIGRFAWVNYQYDDMDGFSATAVNTGAGPPIGFVHREQQGLITTYLSASGMTIPAGFPVTLMSGGEYWVKNAGSGQALPPFANAGPNQPGGGYMYAFAAFADGRVTFAAGQSSGVGITGTGNITATGSIGPGTTTFLGSISGNVLTVTGSVTGTIVVGGTLSGGTGMVSGTQIVSQLSGSIGGTGTYAVAPGEQTVGAALYTETYGTVNITVLSSGTLGVGNILTGSGASILAGTYITALGTGTGGTGTYIVNNTQTIASTTITTQQNVQTKYVAMSSGLTGELVKISSLQLG